MPEQAVSWRQLPWKQMLATLRQMQAALTQAEQEGKRQEVTRLQDKLIHSEAAKFLAVRQVTSTNGRHTPGIDGSLWETPARKLQAAQNLDVDHYHPQPARRVSIPKQSNRLRPLGIFTMKDRAMQAIYAFALAPLAEACADPHSYGFRKYRAAIDAIGRCAEIIQTDQQAHWVLEADIERCFETISHEWLLHHIPMDTRLLQQWLRVGYMEHGQHVTATQGLPQGAILSPPLANMALDGLESLFETISARRRHLRPLYGIRYADDFLVIGQKKRLLAHEVSTAIETFLQARGMHLSPQKTKITHLKHGVDFLGYHLQLIRGRLTITPSARNVARLLQKIDEALAAHPDASAARLIETLSPIIRGWAEYYKYLEDRQPFIELDQQISRRVWNWAKAQQTGWCKRRRARPLFSRGPGNLRLLTDEQGHTLYCAQEIPSIPHVPIDPACNPYDPAWADYLRERQHTRQVTRDSFQPNMLTTRS